MFLRGKSSGLNITVRNDFMPMFKLLNNYVVAVCISLHMERILNDDSENAGEDDEKQMKSWNIEHICTLANLEYNVCNCQVGLVKNKLTLCARKRSICFSCW